MFIQVVQVTLIALLLYLLYRQFFGYYLTTVNVRSTVDGKYYTVRDGPRKQESADALARISKRLGRLVSYVSEQHKEDNVYGTYVQNIMSRFNPSRIRENYNDDGSTSYTMNKKDMYFCLRPKPGEERVGQENLDNMIHDDNLLMFVAIHELAHQSTPVKDYHNELFKKNFKFLLHNAEKLGIYRPENYRENPRQYCGITISNTPLEF